MAKITGNEISPGTLINFDGGLWIAVKTQKVKPGKGGAYNQGWKDSGQALVNTDGSIVTTPIALVEIQGYVYDGSIHNFQQGA